MSSDPERHGSDDYATTEYTVQHDGTKRKVGDPNYTKHKKRLSFRKQELTPLTSLMKTDPTLPTIDSKTENTPVISTSTNLAKALGTNTNANNGSRNDLGSMTLDTIKTKALTFRMMSDRPDLQIRIKLYLPHESNDPNPQSMIVFINSGTTMKTMIEFLEAAYPQNYLKGRIKQLCIADEDGDIDEDFPPMQLSQDISAIGVGHFHIDCIFDNESDNEDDDDDDGGRKRSSISKKQSKETRSVSDEQITNTPFSKESYHPVTIELPNSQLSQQLYQKQKQNQRGKPSSSFSSNKHSTSKNNLTRSSASRSSVPSKNSNRNHKSARNSGSDTKRNSSKQNKNETSYSHPTIPTILPDQVNKQISTPNNKANTKSTKKKKKKKQLNNTNSIYKRLCCCGGDRQEDLLIDNTYEEIDDGNDSQINNTDQIVGYHPPNYKENESSANRESTRLSQVSNRQFGMV